MPILKEFLENTVMGFHHDELKERRKKPSRPPLNKFDLIFKYDDF